LVTRFRLEACFDIVASPPLPVRTVSIHPTQRDPTIRLSCRARPSFSLRCCCIFSFYSS
jgi:hypothetical protein